jgi:hypothetical protein
MPGARTGAEVRVVRRDAAVAVDAHHLAEGLGEVLRRAALLPFAERDEQRLVTAEDEPRAEVPAAAHLRLLLEDDLHGSGAPRRPAGRAPRPCRCRRFRLSA